MAKILISGYYGYDNFGDEVILSVLTGHLKSRNHDITVLSNNPEKTSNTYGVNSVKNFELLKLISAISNCDVLISGGGSLLQDVTSLKSLLYYSFVIWLAQKLGKKVIIFAQGIGPLRSNTAKRIVPSIISKCSIVTVRDEKSLEYLNKQGINATLVSDPVFSVELPQNSSDGAVGIQLRAFKNVDDTFLTNLANRIVTEFGNKKIELFVLQESIDYPICQNFQKILNKLAPYIETEIVHKISQTDLIVRISQLEYMIAMRFHAVLVAIKSGVKTLAINYDAKVAKLAYDAMLPFISISNDEDWQLPFEQLRNINTNDLLKYCSTKHFEWSIFDEII